MIKIEITQLISLETYETLGFFNNVKEVQKFVDENQPKGWLRMKTLEYWI